MNGRRVEAIFQRVVAEIRRDRPSLALLFVAPVLMTGLVTFILRGGTTPPIHALIVNQAGAGGAVVTAALERGLVTEDPSATVSTAPDEANARSAVEDGRATIAIVLPSDLGSTASPTVTVITKGLDPTGEAGQVGTLQKAMLSVAASLTGRPLPTIEHATVFGVPSNDPITTYAPAIVGFFVYFFVYILTGVSFLRERTGGTLERLMATPVTRGEVVAGYTLGFGLFAVIQVVILILWSLGSVTVPAIGPLPSFEVGLGIRLVGSPLLAFVVVLIAAVGAVCLAIFLSTFARTELQIVQFIPIVITPQFVLSGVLFPVDSLPDILKPVPPFLPLTYAVDGLRQVFVRGADLGVAALQTDLLVLAAFAVFFAFIASLTIRRDVV